ncbi:hypothetical protein EV356DRAFT_497511 [Viridothelium virens]|uniref:Uncharacterized protein n=1 Tax=Viridothelium virens TaxID=1048519 RepID=A0A6A6GTC2_VIRVR|nr:hypothetical protein EV356DRAFT_497511 [Viridothelium virens]
MSAIAQSKQLQRKLWSAAESTDFVLHVERKFEDWMTSGTLDARDPLVTPIRGWVRSSWIQANPGTFRGSALTRQLREHPIAVTVNPVFIEQYKSIITYHAPVPHHGAFADIEIPHRLKLFDSSASANWRKMFVTQPPCKAVSIAWFRSVVFPYYGSFKTIENPEGVRIGDLSDVLSQDSRGVNLRDRLLRSVSQFLVPQKFRRRAKRRIGTLMASCLLFPNPPLNFFDIEGWEIEGWDDWIGMPNNSKTY